jgi:hypothetical protein
MVVMITPVSFSSIGYRTYVIFAVMYATSQTPPTCSKANKNKSNAFIFPCVYFFYPETAYRSLEEIDNIFIKTSRGWRGWFGVVEVAKNEPQRYGKNGELLIDYENEEHFRRASIATHSTAHADVEKHEQRNVENIGASTETGSGNSSDDRRGENV